ncbi:MAG TPA: hypothetical protein DDX85_01865 [Nitrospiraceae bacterium]|nr:hypothetical protein [Nitrospiraceae bacterium]
MSDRNFKRIPVNIEADIIASGISYKAFIRNISEYGIHIKIPNMRSATYAKSNTNMVLKFRLPSGESVNLYCRKKWAGKITSNSFIENIGAEILDPPDEYKDFCRVLSHV